MVTTGKLIREQELPTTRLELRWRAADPNSDGYTLKCEYLLILGLDDLDIRGEQYGDDYDLLFRKRAKVLELGGTHADGRSPLDLGAQRIRTPFRDGAHIRWDSKRLGNLPMFVVCDGWAQQIEAAKDDASEAWEE